MLSDSLFRIYRMTESKDCATFIVMGASVSKRLSSNGNVIYIP